MQMRSIRIPEIIGFSAALFRRGRSDETILIGHETIFPLWCRYPETGLGYQAARPNAVPAAGFGDRSMRTLSFILAFAFVLAGPTMAGSVDDLPAAGTFAYNGGPAANPAPLVLAAIN